MNLFEEVKSLVSITDVCGMYGVRLNSNNMGYCPVHKEKTPSFKVYTDTNSFYCFGCGIGGSVIDLVSHLSGLSPVDAAHKLNIDFGLNLESTGLSKQANAEYLDRVRTREYIQLFDELLNRYYEYVTRRIGIMKRLKEISTPKSPEDLENEGLMYNYQYAINELSVLEHKQDVLLIGSIQDKVSLLSEVKEVEMH